jgi:ribosomal-protein-alanine N-acetyltransferase
MSVDVQLSFRPATAEDLSIITTVENACYPKPWPLASFQEELSKPFSHFLVLTDDETDSQIFGYLVFWVMFDEIHLLNITVPFDHRGMGLGRRMLQHVVSVGIQKNCRRIFLEVRKSNAGAIALYQKQGFFVDHIKKAFYEDGEDAYFMVLYLNRKNEFETNSKLIH